MTDIHIRLPPYTVNLRTAAILRNADNVLLCKLTHGFWFLPGGRIPDRRILHRRPPTRAPRKKSAATSTSTAWPSSPGNFFRLDHQAIHEICFVYEAQWTGPQTLRPPAGECETLRWFKLPELANVQLKSDFIKSHIVQPEDSLRHAIHADASFRS